MAALRNEAGRTGGRRARSRHYAAGPFRQETHCHPPPLFSSLPSEAISVKCQLHFIPAELLASSVVSGIDCLCLWKGDFGYSIDSRARTAHSGLFREARARLFGLACRVVTRSERHQR
jgi:hypothetical protein